MLVEGLHLCDFPTHDMSADFVLLAEQRQAGAQLHEKAQAETKVLEERAGQLELEKELVEQSNFRCERSTMQHTLILFRSYTVIHAVTV